MAGSPRVVLVTGKGGVGKTTTAAALALEAARSGYATLLLSTDAAHSVGDVFGRALKTAEHWSKVEPLEDQLWVQAVNHRTEVAADWRVIQHYLLDVLEGLGVDTVVAEELTSLPGADESAALLALGHHLDHGRYDVLIVDCAPSAETLRMLSLPDVLSWHLGQILPAQRRILTALRPAAAHAAGLRWPGPEVLAVIDTWRQRMLRVHAALTGEFASVRLVLTPERMVIAEARRLLTALSLQGYAVDGVVVNRLFPAGGDPWRNAWSVAQHEGVAHIVDSFVGIPVQAVSYAAAEPIGMQALASLWQSATMLAGERAPLSAAVTHRPLRIVADGDDFVLHLAVPFTRSQDITVARRDDDLIITIGAHRRVLALPSALRRCVVKNAAVGNGELKVRFARDPRQWPRV